MSFIGRFDELERLRSLKRARKASLVVVTGRRRIGKSALIQQFGKEFSHTLEFQGLAPRNDATNNAQLKNFAEQTKVQCGGAEPIFHNWTEAFDHIAKEIGKKPALLFLDELSWMGKYDRDFVGKLKIAWDTKFSKVPGLILVLCGSVSAWIEDNILEQTDFVGRISLTLRLTELDLKHAVSFWGQQSKRISIIDRLSYISVVGGIPKYLEEYDPTQSTEMNIKRLCFTTGGYLVEDFDKIFSDIFEKKSETYRHIVRTLVNSHLSPLEISAKLEKDPGGDLSQHLRELELSGFISRDYFYKPGGAKGKLSKLRISDSYLRFYLKYIEPNRDKISKGIFHFSGLKNLLAWEAIRGLQFENLLINRIPEVLEMLNLSHERIVSVGPYFQNRTLKTRACQIDLLIECKPNNFYICEIKWQKLITTKIIDEMAKKLTDLKLPKYSSRRPVLMYVGELEDSVIESDFFDKLVDLREIFE